MSKEAVSVVGIGVLVKYPPGSGSSTDEEPEKTTWASVPVS
jgi:hypothetical protein